MSHLAEIQKHSVDQVRRVWSPDNNLFRQNSAQDEDLLRVWCKAKFWRGEVLRGYDRDRKMTKCVKHDADDKVPRTSDFPYHFLRDIVFFFFCTDVQLMKFLSFQAILFFTSPMDRENVFQQCFVCVSLYVFEMRTAKISTFRKMLSPC